MKVHSKSRVRPGPPPELVSKQLPWIVALPMVLAMIGIPSIAIYDALIMDPNSKAAPIFNVLGSVSACILAVILLGAVSAIFEVRRNVREQKEYKEELAKIMKGKT